MWAAYDCYLTAARDILGLRFPCHAGYAHWEAAAIHGGFRAMHEKFCMISDFPRVLRTNAQGQPHCEDGPSHQWRDGWSFWYIDGVQVDEQIVMRPQTQTLKQIDQESNAEVRRLRIQRYGWPRFLRETNAHVLDFRRNDVDGTDESLMQSRDGSKLLVCACPSTAKIFAMHVPREITKCDHAQRWLAGERRLNIVGAS